MLGKLLPSKCKSFLQETFRWQLRANLGHLQADLKAKAQGFFAHAEGADSFLLLKHPPKGDFSGQSTLPVPPKELMGVYGLSVESYLETGKRDVEIVRDLVEKSGMKMEAAERILDFGCSSGRMIRWLLDLANRCEIWGTDIRSSRIFWCQQYLRPPFHFATTTIEPHLPFEDRYFDLIFAGSVFTHIDDLAYTWFLELRRVLRPGGRLYITIHDRKTVAILKNNEKGDEYKSLNKLKAYPDYQEFSNSDFGMFTLGRSLGSQVFYDAEYLGRSLEPFFRTLSIAERAYYFYQTGVLLERL